MILFKTKAEAVLEQIRQRIIDNEIAPGERIVISDVAKEYGISEIPVREAIRKLESQGLVNFTPHVGAVVNKIAGDEFLEIYLMRIELEVLATKLAVPHMNQTVIEALREDIKLAQEAIEAGNNEQLGPLNKSFHLKIYKTGPYPYLYNTIVDLWDKFELMKSVFAYVPKRAIPSWAEHEKMVAALETKNIALVAKLVRQQKNRTKKALEKLFIKN
jgi:DNA-binding GntR family transcriptional regulator